MKLSDEVIMEIFHKIISIYKKIGVIRLIAFLLIGVEICLIIHDIYAAGYTEGQKNGYTQGYQKATQEAQIKIRKLSQSLEFAQSLALNPSGLPVMEKPKFYISTIEGTLSYSHAIDIAKSYYDKQSYKSAIIWAYRANQINPNDIKSWEIYLKSLQKIGTNEEIKKSQELMKRVNLYFGKKIDEKSL